MDEYVSREAVRDMLHNEISSWGGCSEEIEALLNANEKLFELPVADVVEVKHGRWIPFKSKHAGDIQYCSSCDVGCTWRPDYCPNCGAKMDGE